MKGEENLEVEVKFFVTDLPALRQRILSLNIPLHHPRIFEQNLRWDNAWDGLLRKGELLRLRQDSRTRLTFKGAAHPSSATELKVREELEVELDDFQKMAAILERIGFQPRQSYEKYRETFWAEGVEIVLDELPFGDFVELEGDEPAIRQMAETLGLPWDERILDNYLLLMNRLKQAYELPFEDCTFANFAGTNLTVAGILKRP